MKTYAKLVLVPSEKSFRLMSCRKLEVRAPNVYEAQKLFIQKAHELGLDVRDVKHSPIGVKVARAA